MRTFPPFVLALLLSSAVSADPLGIYPLTPTGNVSALGDKLRVALHDGVAQLPGVQAVDIQTTTRCTPHETACLASAGQVAGVPKVVHGDIERADEDGYGVRLQLVDSKTGFAREVKRRVHGGPADLLGAVALTACELIAEKPARCVGHLAVEGTKDLELLVDGWLAGRLPQAAPAEVLIGRHAVQARSAGMASEIVHVHTTYDGHARLRATLHDGFLELVDLDSSATTLAFAPAVPVPVAAPGVLPMPGKLQIMRAGGWAVVTSGLLVASVGAGFGVYANSTASDLQSSYAAGTLSASDASRYDSFRSAARMANVMVAAAVALGAAGGTLLYMAPQSTGAGGDVR